MNLKRTGPIVAVAALVGLAVASSGGPGASIWPKPPARFLLLGDSLALGLNAPLRSELARFVWAPTHARIGATLADFRNVEAILDETKPSVVIVSLGTNDAAAPSPDYHMHFGAHAVEFVRAIQATGARVVWLMPPEMPFETEDILDAIVRSGATYLMPPSTLERAADRIHLTQRGYAAWAHRVAIQ